MKNLREYLKRIMVKMGHLYVASMKEYGESMLLSRGLSAA